jgi:MSHA type pilus biogenesis protein MshL
MKTKCNFIFFLVLILAIGCVSPPKKEQPKPSAQLKETTLPQPTPEVTLKELVIPQKEEAKRVPEKLFSFFARDASIQDVLLAFSREGDLNIVIDPEISGKVTVDLKRVTLREALDAILFPLGWTYRIDGRFIQITRPQMETRLFTLNYISTKRTGKRDVYASTGGGIQAAGTTIGQQGIVSTGTTRAGYSDLISTDEMDMWREIQGGLEVIIFGSPDDREKNGDKEKATLTRVDGKGKKLAINKSTGVILVNDYPINLNKVASYLEMVEGSSQRQVTIQAKIMEVILSDDYKAGINWKVIEGLPRSINLSWGLTDKAGTTGFPGGTTGEDAETIATPGTFNIKPFGGTFAIGALGAEVALSDIVEAIAEQGDVKILSNPTLSTLNNQKAIIRVGDQDVFFIVGAVATESTVTQTIQPVTIDIGIILDVTPQIAEDGTILMSIHPSITHKTGEKTSPDGRTTFPLLSVRETDTTVRVRDGQTIIIAGLMAERRENTSIGVPVLKSVPLLGGLFKYKSENKRNAELVIMITPTVQIGKKVEDFTKKNRTNKIEAPRPSR